jgi:hypothetical protein
VSRTYATIAVLTITFGSPAAVTRRAMRQPTSANPTQSPTAPSTVQATNDAFVQKISKQITGHDQEPAAQVFKNIQLDGLKKTPASRFLLIMNLGYSRGLGVTCDYCHVVDDFSKDDRRPKRAAREMALMHTSINQQLAKMENLEPNPQGHFVNCSTCHRGSIKPNQQAESASLVSRLQFL